MNKLLRRLGLFGGIICLSLVCAYAQRGERYDLSWWTIDAGGVTFGQDAGGRLLIGGAFGQPDASEYLTDAFGRFELRGGFWYTVPTEAGCSPASGDVDRNGCVDDADLLQVLFAFGETGSNPADSNCDGTVDDADLLEVLFNFGNGCGG